MNFERAIISALLLIAAGFQLSSTETTSPSDTAHAGLSFLPAIVPGTTTSDKTFEVDNMYSCVYFRVKHMKASNFYGRFNKVSGEFKIDADNLDNSFVNIKVDVNSVDTNDEARDKFLKGQAFFSVKEFSTMSFKSTSIAKKSDDSFTITGNLTLHGKSNEVTFDAAHTGTANVSPRWGLRSGYEAIFDIDRKDYGMAYGTQGGFMGHDIRLMISLHGMLSK